MKKLLAILLALLILVGCSGGGNGGGNDGGGDDGGADVVIFQNENVRKAMSYAIDRVSLAKSLNDGSVAAEGIIPFQLAGNPSTGADFREDQGSVVAYDVDQAKDFYAKACEELGKKELTVDLLYGTNEGDSVIKAAEQIAYYLEEVGFKVNLVSKQKKERLQLMDTGGHAGKPIGLAVPGPPRLRVPAAEPTGPGYQRTDGRGHERPRRPASAAAAAH